MIFTKSQNKQIFIRNGKHFISSGNVDFLTFLFALLWSHHLQEGPYDSGAKSKSLSVGRLNQIE